MYVRLCVRVSHGTVWSRWHFCKGWGISNFSSESWLFIVSKQLCWMIVLECLVIDTVEVDAGVLVSSIVN